MILLLAQIVATFSPQPKHAAPLAGITPWAVHICTSSPQAQMTTGGAIYRAITPQLSWITPSDALRVAQTSRQRSAVGMVAVVLEVAAWSLTAAQATDLAKIRDKWKAAAPVGAGAIEMGRNLLRRENPEWVLPANVLPPWVAVPPSGCAEHTIFARRGQQEMPFSMEMKP